MPLQEYRHTLEVNVIDSQRRPAPFERIRIQTESGPICDVTYQPGKTDSYHLHYKLKRELKFITLVLIDSTGEYPVNIIPGTPRHNFHSQLRSIMTEEKKPYRILSLSGGGIRGIFQSLYLAKVSEALHSRPFYTNFDLITGTSTGALLAIGIALDVDVPRLNDIYHRLAPKIFTPAHKYFSMLRRGPKYLNQDLKEILTDVFGNRQLADCKVSVVIPATTLDRYSHRVFTSLMCDGRPIPGSDSSLSAIDVAMASAAAPTYFQAVRPAGEVRTYVDGGMWANNPALVAVIEAHTRMKIPFEQMRLVSVGNGEVPEGMLPAEYASKRSLQMIDPIFTLMFSSQATAADDFAETLIGSENMLKVNVSLTEDIRLDDFETAIGKLRPLAEDMFHRTERKLQQLVGAPLPA